MIGGEKIKGDEKYTPPKSPSGLSRMSSRRGGLCGYDRMSCKDYSLVKKTETGFSFCPIGATLSSNNVEPDGADVGGVFIFLPSGCL
jgi:hypothetical protein